MSRKIVIACDSFKGSLTAAEAVAAAALGAGRALSDSTGHRAADVEIVGVPVADGGEGTTRMITDALAGRYVTVRVSGPLGRQVEATYGIVGPEDGTLTAVIEVAAAAGLTLLAPQERNPLITTTRGVGKMLADAYARGCRRFIVGLGGSATNDGGAGMLRALGVRFLDCEGRDIGEGGAALASLERIDASGARRDVLRCPMTVLCDVRNPLTGPQGASAVFGPQKGATAADVALLDSALTRYGRVLSAYVADSKISQNADGSFSPADIASMAGAGAAGGTGVALLAFANVRLVPGVLTALQIICFDEIVREASLVITGEGRSDAQTLQGKAPTGVLRYAGAIPTILLSGAVSDAQALLDAGFASVRAATPEGMPLAEAMRPEVAARNLADAAERAVRDFFGE